MNKRFITKYHNLTDSVLMIDTLKRMPFQWVIHDYCGIHGLMCNDSEIAEKWQNYLEKLCGVQRSLIQEVSGIKMKSQRACSFWDEIPEGTDYGIEYVVYDNTGMGLRFNDKEDAIEFKEWWEKELNGGF